MKQKKIVSDDFNPVIEEKNKDFSPESFFKDKKNTDNKIKNDLNLPDIIDLTNDKNKEGADSFFQETIKQLMSDENISLKTEYMNEDETFTGSKLEFLTRECGFESGQEFLPIWEKKRVSQGRKSRQEVVLTLRERMEERMAQEERERRERVGVEM